MMGCDGMRSRRPGFIQFHRFAIAGLLHEIPTLIWFIWRKIHGNADDKDWLKGIRSIPGESLVLLGCWPV